MSNLPTVDENNPCSSAGPAFTPSVAPPQDDDEYSFASDVTTERVKSSKSIREQKLTLLFGSDFKIQRNQLEGYIEFRSIVEAAPEKFEDSAVAGFLGDLIADIEANPLNSILISSGYNRNGERLEIWNAKSTRRELEWEQSCATMAGLQVAVENMRNTLDIQEKKMNKETELYHMYRRALDSKQKSMEDATETAREQFLDKNHAKMLAHLQRHFDSSDCWKNETPETVQFKLRLSSKMDVKRLTKSGCDAIIFTLKAMKYEQTPFFQGLWALPPTEFTQETWKDMCGYRREILLGHASRKTMQRRICYYLGLPADGIDDDDIPSKPTLEQIDSLERSHEERSKNRKRKFDAMREAINLEAKAKQKRREAEEMED